MEHKEEKEIRCERDDLSYTSNPPKNRCKNCHRFWTPSKEETPVCTIPQPPESKEDSKFTDHEKCICGHERKHHGKSFSINYTEGLCNKDCGCKNFLMHNVSESLEEKGEELTYKKKNLFTVVEVDYSDDTVLFEMEGTDEDGNTWSSGMYTLEDLIVRMLFKVGKIDETKTYNFNYPKND